MHDHRRSRAQRSRPWIRGAVVAATALVAPLAFAATASGPPEVLGIPVDFILFALTLLGVALFHHHTLRVALTGLATITVYKLAFTGFKTGAGIAGTVGHLAHEWVILTNLLGLLLGFALLAKHFEDSRVPGRAAAVPAGRLEGRVRAARDDLRAVELSRQHRGRADRRHDGAHRVPRQGAHRLSRGDRRRIERRRRGQRRRRHDDDDDVDRRRESAIAVLTPTSPRRLALSCSASPPRCSSKRYSPIVTDAGRRARSTGRGVGIVAFILVAAIAANVIVNIAHQRICRQLSVHRRGGVGGDPRHRAVAQARLEPAAGGVQGHDLPAVAGDLRLA